MSNRLDAIRKDRLSEIDDILDIFQGKLSLEDILNQDYSLITDLAEVRNEKNAKQVEELEKGTPPNPPNKNTMADNIAKAMGKDSK